MLRDDFFRRIYALGRKRSTGETYWHNCCKYMLWLKKTNGDWVHPKQVGRDEIESWLSHLANDLHVSPRTQNQALQSVLFLYKQVLGVEIENVNAIRAKEPRITIKDVLSRREVSAIISELRGVNRLIAQLLYAGAMRRSDVLQLRVKDLHFDTCQIALKATKHNHQHWTLFPESLHAAVRRQIAAVDRLRQRDLKANPNGVSLPHSFRRKSPNACHQIAWWFLFPSRNLSACPETKIVARHHRDASHVNRSLGEAARRAGVDKRVTSHILRHSSATHLHESGVPLADIQQILGHASIETTMTYVHSDQSASKRMRSPFDDLPGASVA